MPESHEKTEKVNTVSRPAFEELLLALSTRFVNLKPEDVRYEIEHGLRRILELFGGDRCTFLEVSADEGKLLVTHRWATDRAPAVPPEIYMPGEFPWLAGRVGQGEGCFLESVDDFPVSANRDRESFSKYGFESVAIIPVPVSGRIAYVLGIGSYWQTIHWPEELMPLMRLTADVFANALERKRKWEELQENEKHLRIVADSFPGAVSFLDKEMRFVFVNKRYEKWFGVPRDQIIGRKPPDFQLPEHIDKATPYFHEMLKGKEVRYEMTTTLPSGESADLEVTYSPSLDEAGQYQGAIVIALDVSERNSLQAEARKHLATLAHVDRTALMSALTASLAHEINQPLTAILSNAQAARRMLKTRNDAESEIQEILADIVKDDKRVSEVLRRVRGLLADETDRHECFNLNGIIKIVLKLVRSAAVIHNIEIDLDVMEEPAVVRGDSIQLQQVLLNLIMNAGEAMEDAEGERRITIHTRKSGEIVTLSVDDSGPGIPPDHGENIFEMFYTTKEYGTGMGLAICKSILKVHGGKLQAENLPEGGARISFSLPLVTGHGS